VINQFLDILKLIQLELICLFAVFFIISLFWKKIYISLSLKAYHSKQRLHQEEIPRIGGLIIYVFLIMTAFFSLDSDLLNVILMTAIPIIFIGVKEDLFHNTSPKLRLIFMIVSASLFVTLLPTNLPEIDFPIINQVLSFSILKEIFFIFAILVIINGNNLIDGVNGNMALTNIVQLVVLALLASTVNDSRMVEVYLILMLPLIIFLIFNFPMGKIFSGDVGAYFYGFAISASVIYLFGEYDQFFSWNAVLILIYPSSELLFSFIRKKIFESKSPFFADRHHLHTLIYKLIKTKTTISNNSFVLFFLFPLILTPIFAVAYFDDLKVISFIIAFIMTMYIFCYIVLHKIIYLRKSVGKKPINYFLKIFKK
jgi:UDP-N-acetylmuramyl pentapeptide phosphotransferase/UDP-N-acetylglucosamine-1-phosphate transferase